MGAVVASDKVYDGIVNNSKTPIEFFHGYTYSGHPIAAAAGIATLKVYKEEKLFERVASLATYFEEKIHTLKDCKNVIDIRNIGLVGAIQLAPIDGKVGQRGTSVFEECYKRNLLVRPTGDTIALSPAYIVTKDQIDEIVATLKEVINSVD